MKKKELIFNTASKINLQKQLKKTASDYFMPLVSLANTKQFVASAEATLLDAARIQGLVLEHSCRTGRCGVCKAKIISGKTAILQSEEALTNADIEAGYILTCCRAAIDDVELDIEDLGRLGSIKKQTLPCKIAKIAKLVPDVIQIWLRLPPNNNFEYLAGQYIDVIAKSGVRRSYSIANAHHINNTLELHIRQVSDGIMSHYWFNEAKENDLLRLDGPHGTFCFREKEQNNIIFLATGTGIAPIKSILEDLNNSAATDIVNENVRSKNIYVYWGGRVPQDIYWQPNYENLNIHFYSTLSRADEAWRGRRGYVQDALLEEKIDITDAVVYACGSDAMIHTAKKQLMLQGLDPKNFFSDAFVSSK